MPQRGQRACRKCGRLHRNANGYCDGHQPERSNWRKHNKGKSSTKRGYGARWRDRRDRILRRDNYLCQVCKAAPADAVDHIVPKAEGGTDSDGNLQAICDDCHKVKTREESTRARQRAAT